MRPSGEHWLRRPVVLGLAGLLVGLYALAFGQRTAGLAANGWLDGNGLPFGGDFVAFWAGARLALDGRAVDAFDPAVIFPLQESAIPGSRAHFLWNYPPPFHLVVLPFGLLGAVAACWLWWAVTVPAFVASCVRILPRWETALVALSGSAVLLNLAHGQNGFLVAAIWGLGLELVRRGSSVWGGLVLGCLAIKPHLAVLLPVALASAGAWRAFGATAVSLCGWLAVSTAAFGVGYWSAFVGNLGAVQGALDRGELPPGKLVTAYVGAIGLGASPAVAGVVQVLVALGAAVAVGLAFRGGITRGACAALLVASCLPSPYLFDYDLILLSVAGTFAVAHGLDVGFVPGERELWLLAALLPIALAPLWSATAVPFGPLLLVALLGVTWVPRPPADAV